MALSNKLTAMLGCEHPIMLAGMGGIAGKELVAAVSNAGGFGVWGSAVSVQRKGPDELREELGEIRRMCNGRPFGIDILVHGTDGGVLGALIDVFAESGARAFVSGKGYPKREVVDMFHKRGMLVGSIAGKTSHATGAVAAGVDFVIAQGYEAGGHTGKIASSVLVPAVVDAVGGKVPVVAAGGIWDGRGLAASLCWGASGVWVGTRFMLTPESATHPLYKSHMLKYKADDTIVTKAYTGSTMRCLDNHYVQKYEQNPALLEKMRGKTTIRALRDGVWKLHGGDDKDVDISIQAFVVGQNIESIDTLKPAAQVVQEMVDQACALLSRLAPGGSAPRSRL
eukprot:TRINITY_DN13750_c0_g1_i1.p1 TRINITY_DN13750_c0_g1~~TRINITY_DN13750_c0_g1_i1.p1  ORF type:complete len:339 (+),score=88.21 TRINITY_DN13750_c0_g1_i1:95-1111(+)